MPKTLIFAKDDSHADDIVQIVREVFGKGNQFATKITYRTRDGKPEDLLQAFRNSMYPRIVVTVDMIATGTDVKPLECLVFMRSVKSRTYFEQMLGRGVRVINDTEFQAVTDDAKQALNATSQRLNLISTELQEGVMKTRMQPIGMVWNKLPRVVRDMAVSLGKQIRLEMDGADTELDRTIIEAIKDPLVHLVRNSCDHGIETPPRCQCSPTSRGRCDGSAGGRRWRRRDSSSGGGRWRRHDGTSGRGRRGRQDPIRSHYHREDTAVQDLP